MAYRCVGHLLSTRLARALPPACSACEALGEVIGEVIRRPKPVCQIFLFDDTGYLGKRNSIYDGRDNSIKKNLRMRR